MRKLVLVQKSANCRLEEKSGAWWVESIHLQVVCGCFSTAVAELSSCDKDCMAQSLTFLQKRATSQTADFCSGIVMIRDPNVVLNEIKKMWLKVTLCVHPHTHTHTHRHHYLWSLRLEVNFGIFFLYFLQKHALFFNKKTNR